MRPEEIFSGEQEVLGGEPVFTGTRVPVKYLVDHLVGGDPLDDFTAHSVTAVTREQTVAFLEWALEAARRQASGEGEYWLERVPEPWASKLRTEIYSEALKARRILDAATIEEDRLRARERVREMGFDPDGVPRFPSVDERRRG